MRDSCVVRALARILYGALDTVCLRARECTCVLYMCSVSGYTFVCVCGVIVRACVFVCSMLAWVLCVVTQLFVDASEVKIEYATYSVSVGGKQ